MAYILFVNPSILGETGMDKGAVFVATCLAAAIGSTIMGLIANYPIALAPAWASTPSSPTPWCCTWATAGRSRWAQCSFPPPCSSCVDLSHPRMDHQQHPLPLRSAIAAGIGLFLALIALQNAGIVVDNPATLIGMGDLTAGTDPRHPRLHPDRRPEARSVTGAVLIGILVVTAIAILLGVTQFGGVVSMPPSLAPTFLQLDIKGALDIGLVSVIFAFLFVDLFDNSGTLIGVAKRAGLMATATCRRWAAR